MQEQVSKVDSTQNALIVGGGMAGLTVACLLTKSSIPCTLLERNWLPGGCVSSYPRKNYVFETGATTLVGLDEHMPLRYLLDQLELDISPLKLDIPMRVYLKSGEVLTRYQDIDQWIAEAERVFGAKGQRPFWEQCYRISQFVWETSLQQRAFPPSNLADLLYAARNFRPKQLGFAALAFQSTASLLRKYGLHTNLSFVEFVNEQLLITAQNHMEEVNVLFGATALCYTNYANYYMPGGLINLVKPLVTYLEENGSQVVLREPVLKITAEKDAYIVEGKKDTYKSKYLVSAIPINNTLELVSDPKIIQKYQRKILTSESLNSAFQLSFVAKKRKRFDCLHHQIHLTTPLPYSNSASIFLSLSHPDDTERCGANEFVGSVSTHVHHPDQTYIHDKEIVVEAIFDELTRHGFLQKEDIIFHHASTPKAWKKWTARKWGFVGGYPQYMDIKPWQMLDARIDHKGMYACGDSTYPGQGIPGACLSGIIAFEKMRIDGILKHKSVQTHDSQVLQPTY